MTRLDEHQLTCDVLVAGGGMAGVCTALAAARCGQSKKALSGTRGAVVVLQVPALTLSLQGCQMRHLRSAQKCSKCIRRNGERRSMLR